LLTGKYIKVPKKFRLKLNDYYGKCEEWNSKLEIVNFSKDLREGKIKNMTVLDDGRRLIIEHPDGRKVEKYSLVGTPEYKEYESIEQIDLDEATDLLKDKQQHLRNLNEKLLSELEGKIR